MVLKLREHTLVEGASAELSDIWDRFPPLKQYLEREYRGTQSPLFSFKGAALPHCRRQSLILWPWPRSGGTRDTACMWHVRRRAMSPSHMTLMLPCVSRIGPPRDSEMACSYPRGVFFSTRRSHSQCPRPCAWADCQRKGRLELRGLRAVHMAGWHAGAYIDSVTAWCTGRRQHTVAYVGGLDDRGAPHGVGAWSDSYKHGEFLVGCAPASTPPSSAP